MNRVFCLRGLHRKGLHISLQGEWDKGLFHFLTSKIYRCLRVLKKGQPGFWQKIF